MRTLTPPVEGCRFTFTTLPVNFILNSPRRSPLPSQHTPSPTPVQPTMDEQQAFVWNNRWADRKHRFRATAGEKVKSDSVVERLRWLDQRSSLRALLPEGTAAQQEMFASRMPAFPKSAGGIVEALGDDKKQEAWRSQRRSQLVELEKQIMAARAKQKAEEDAARELELQRETESSRLFAYSGKGYASPPKSLKEAWAAAPGAAGGRRGESHPTSVFARLRSVSRVRTYIRTCVRVPSWSRNLTNPHLLLSQPNNRSPPPK